MEPRYKWLPRTENAERERNPTGGCFERELEALTIGMSSEAETKWHERRPSSQDVWRESYGETLKMQRGPTWSMKGEPRTSTRLPMAFCR